MHIWLVESCMVIVFAKSQFFPYNKGIDFNLTIMVVETTLRRYPQLNPN